MPLASQDEEFREFQAEVDEQQREPYQNADQMADWFIHMGRTLPEYSEPSEYGLAPDYDAPYSLPPMYEL